jgi:hypothetical protein
VKTFPIFVCGGLRFVCADAPWGGLVAGRLRPFGRSLSDHPRMTRRVGTVEARENTRRSKGKSKEKIEREEEKEKAPASEGGRYTVSVVLNNAEEVVSAWLYCTCTSGQVNYRTCIVLKLYARQVACTYGE